MTTPPALGVGIGGSIEELVRLARAAEAAGLESVWVAELERSAFVQAAAVASATASVGVGTAVALAFPRSPTITAMAARDLAELSGGRFVLGLGTQVKRVIEARYSVPFDHPADRLAEYAAAVRVVWAAARGDVLTHEGRFYRITMPAFHGTGTGAPAAAGSADLGGDPPLRPDPPILFAAVGPLMSRTAGAVADGLIGHPFASPRFLRERVRPAVEEGLVAAGRPLDGCPISASPLVSISEEEDAARREAKLQIAFYATTRPYLPILRLHGREGIFGDVRRAFVRGDRSRMVELIDDELCDAIAVAGRPDEIRDRLAAWAGVAGRLIVAGPWYGVRSGRATENTAAIIEALAGSGSVYSPGRRPRGRADPTSNASRSRP